MKTTILLLSMLCVACGTQTANETDTVAPRVLKAAKIADAIEANPDEAESILAEHEMTDESFRDLMYEIAADEKMSADFEKSRNR